MRDSNELQQYVVSYLPNVDPFTQQKEIDRLTRLITEVELGLSLLIQVAPGEPATSVEALLHGYRFPFPQLQSDANWKLIQKARFYLIRRKGKQWQRSLEQYISIPEILRIYSLTSSSDVPQLIPSSIFPTRPHLYRQTLSQTPQHEQREIRFVTEGLWYAKISENGHSPVEIPIDIPSEVVGIAPSPQAPLVRTRNNNNPSLTVTFGELLEAAIEMDRKVLHSGQNAQNYYRRLEQIELHIYNPNSDDFDRNETLLINDVLHIAGLLNVGKTALLEVLIYLLAKRGYRCAFIVNDVVSAVRTASLFSHQLSIPAAPVLGNNRQEQLDKVYESLFKNYPGEEITQGGTHPAWRRFSPICPLLVLKQSEEKWTFGQEPCHKLYQKTSNSDYSYNPDADEEDFEEQESEKHTCPFYYTCPRHQLERDLAGALVWILTPASLIKTHVPRQVFDIDLTFVEAVYRECNFLFVDEADRVQVQLDEEFAPDEVLVDGSGNSFLNKLGLILATATYNSNRSNMGASILAAWKRANDYAQIATDLIYNRLLTHPELIDWLGKNAFTGRSLFSHAIRDLLKPEEENSGSKKTKLNRLERIEALRKSITELDLPTQELRQKHKKMMDELDGFLQSPLNRRRDREANHLRRRGEELSELTLTVLSAENEHQALLAVEQWCKKWLQDHNLTCPEGSKLEQLIRNLHFAILITVLDNRLGFIVDNLSELRQIIDLHELNQDLLYRPARDYLPILPESPVGNILGFIYKPDRQNKKQAGKLDYFRYVGVGRSLLLNFPKLFAVDNWVGPHTVLISGTSYAPDSPAYHISKEPTVLLKPKISNPGIGESEFHFSPQFNHKGDYIALSGRPPHLRKLAATEMVQTIASGNKSSFIDQIFQNLKQLEQDQLEWWRDRQRIMMVVGGYDEAELVANTLKPLYRLDSFDSERIATLRRDNAPAHLNGIRRSKIPELKETPTQIVVVPLMALERGFNILNTFDKAAFGAALFLNRPMPVPDNWQSTVQQLNAWALLHEQDPELYSAAVAQGNPLTLTDVGNIFYQQAQVEILTLNCTAWSFEQLTPSERKVLCSTQLVSIWQIIGRLVRGGVPAIVHFLDVKFAPRSANGDKDSEKTSLLVGTIKVLESYINSENTRPFQKTIARSLYGDFLNALQKMQTVGDVNYD